MQAVQFPGAAYPVQTHDHAAPRTDTPADALEAFAAAMETAVQQKQERDREALEDAKIDYLLSVLDRRVREGDDDHSRTREADMARQLEAFRDYAARARVLDPDRVIPFYL